MSVDLRLGDCLEVLPGLAGVDAVVTDPPYGVDGGVSHGGQVSRDKAKYKASFVDDKQYILTVCVPIIQACQKFGVPMAVTTGNRWMHLYPEARDVGCFWTPAAANLGPWGFTTFHPILYYGKDHRAGKGAWPTGKQVTERAEKNGHPCPKPLGAWMWLIEKVTRPGDTVLDPFMGSGTTGVACVKLGRHFIGIEKEPKYFDIATRRIADAQAQLALPV